MEADWDELSRIAMPPPNAHGMPTVATATAFDDMMELLWIGNEYVSVGAELAMLGRDTDRRVRFTRAEYLHFTDRSYNGTPQFEPTLCLRVQCSK